MPHTVCPSLQLCGAASLHPALVAPCPPQIHFTRITLLVIFRIRHRCSLMRNHRLWRSLRTLETVSSTGKAIRSRDLALCRCTTCCRCDAMLSCANSMSISSKRQLYASRRRRSVLLDDSSQAHRVRHQHLPMVHLWPAEDRLNPRAYYGSKGVSTSSIFARSRTHPSREN